MTDAKFCDIHANPNNVVPRDRTMQLALKRYEKSIKRNLFLFLDGCAPCINAKILEVAKSFGVDVENGWRVEVLIRPNTKQNKSAKWKKTFMSVDEYKEFQKELEDETTTEEEEPSTPRKAKEQPQVAK